ncbi:DUF421 domain-containing protein [Peribacillus simplex]|uniref:YetF C-terminal domain-containing protein n=2 Tax=Peribacillus simplex TaxID=1478 RepID=A0A223EG79_9BACI|nr:DUF421 domain-containing protein [Peribacillus simplex]ASS94264.1 hypothetical protein BS1321_10010 [Peribacillus simplex NBRC 15720 = DSM 1321]MEC1397104.1 DUF421 domain-containing protein [Peribacillus simplex]MED3986917.1 DUF421 domain-containing protein [Peribacillus simplex]MED4095752.1 DUF421 domain-containing protein [Peribacillus simplex]TVX79954.1 DUF421 domain-containing protein [Peribacillus simplex]
MPDWIEILLRSLFFLIVLFVITKVLGKKQLSQLSFFEYVTGITIGNVGAELATKVEGNIIHGVLSILVFAIAPFIAGSISLKSKTFRDLVEGKASVFIKDGKVMEDNLKKEKYTIDELLALLRKKDVFDISEVEFALLEANGDFSVMLKKQNQPITAKDLNLSVAAVKEPQTIIMDGSILDEPLSTIGLNRNWLHTELDKLGVILENVFLAQANSNGELTVDLFDDKLKVPSPQEKPLMLATLKKCQADLELFALGTESKEAKEMFSKNSEKLQKAIDGVAHILRN